MKTTAIGILFFALSGAVAVAADTKAGQASYDKACKSCHGPTGAPNPAVAKMLKADMKDLGSAEVQSQTDDQLKKTITEGKGKMKPVHTVSGAALDDVVAYVRTFKK
jgi:predicted CXXCH cytochrome family protein